MANANLNSGSHIGWVCISSGIACNTGWSASTAKAQGNQIFVGDHVYEFAIAGTTGASAPSWSSLQGATTNDGSVTWTRIGSKALFKEYGLIY
jgi:hypothetical protein